MSEILENKVPGAALEIASAKIAESSGIPLPAMPQIGRAFNACISADWAITEDAYRMVLTIASRLNDPKAVETYRSKPLENTERVKIRNGVAIIPITGPIFRYANLFTYFSGGTSITQLARDFQTALDDPSVHAILFEINSPGGEVTGINEFAKMVYAVRKKKKMPVTSRVGGLMCSAALWIGVMTDEIVIDETAQVGSIGVCTTYIDDRKKLEMAGIEEIPIVSMQSPFKNLPPTTEDGLKRVQTRLSALCDVFGAAVALGRNVEIQTVWEKFGKGDVFVGQAAIDAGLADRFGSFEETLDLLAKKHNPNYVPASSYTHDDEEEEPILDDPEDDDDESAKESSEKTLNPESASESLSFDETSAEESAAELDNPENAKEEILKEEVMKEENKDNVVKPAEDNSAADANPESQAADDTAAELERLREENARLHREAAAEKAAREAAEAEQAKTAQKQKMQTVAKEILGDGASEADIAAETDFLCDFAEKFPEDSAQFKTYVTKQKARAAQAETADLFKEAGKTGSTTAASAEEKLNQLAKERQTASAGKLTFEQAYAEVLKENKELFAEAQQ